MFLVSAVKQCICIHVVRCAYSLSVQCRLTDVPEGINSLMGRAARHSGMGLALPVFFEFNVQSVPSHLVEGFAYFFLKFAPTKTHAYA